MACSILVPSQSSVKQTLLTRLFQWIAVLRTDWSCETDKYIEGKMYHQGFSPQYDNEGFFYLPQQFQAMPRFNMNNPMMFANQNYSPRPHFQGRRRQGQRQRQQYDNFYNVRDRIQQDIYGQLNTEADPDTNYTTFSNKRKSDDDESSGPNKRLKPQDYVLKIPPTPKSSSNSQITQAMIEYFIGNHQTEEMYLRKVKLRDALYSILNGVLPHSGLYIVGSSMSGCGTMNSDMDLCLMITDQPIEQMKEAPELLYLIQRAFSKCSFLTKTMVIRAKVPILRFTDAISKVECDLNVNNSVGIRNTHLIKYYCMLDWRVRPLMLYIKMWSRFHDINDARKMTISSYSLCLMVIHYLQYGCKPAVLPSLQKLYPDIFHSDSDIRALRFDHQLKYKSKNDQTMGDLFLGFLEYYTNNFDFSSHVISVRTGTRMQKYMAVNQHDDKKQWKFLNIEEPFDLTNTSRSCYDEHTFERVKRVIRLSYQRLSRSRDVEKILSSPF